MINSKATCVIGPAEDVINYVYGSAEANPNYFWLKQKNKNDIIKLKLDY